MFWVSDVFRVIDSFSWSVCSDLSHGRCSEFSVFEVGIHGIDTGADGVAHLVLRQGYLFGLPDRAFGDLPGNDDDTVAIAEDEVAGANGHTADGHRFAKPVREPALRDIRRREEGMEDRELLLEDEVGV